MGAHNPVLNSCHNLLEYGPMLFMEHKKKTSEKGCIVTEQWRCCGAWCQPSHASEVEREETESKHSSNSRKEKVMNVLRYGLIEVSGKCAVIVWLSS